MASERPMSRPAPRSPIRLALTPRWLVAAGVLLVFVVAAVLLGRWQWDRTQDILAAERAALSQPVAIEQVLPADADLAELPAEATGRPVLVEGTYVPSMQVAVTGRLLGERTGVWIVTGLQLADGRVVAVLRGWLPTADAAGALAPTEPVTVTGVLQPDEPFYADAATAPGTVASIAHDRLADLWSTELVPGYVTLQEQDPPVQPAPVPVPPTVQTGDVAFPWQNFVYAFQWWVFALFAIAVYARWLWLESRRASVDEPQDLLG